MRRKFTLFLASLLVTFCAYSADYPDSKIDLTNADLSQVLRIYKGVSGLDLIIDSRAKIECHITLVSATLKKDELLKLIESTLVTQARIVITRLDDKRASVTFNDALPITR